MRIFNLILFLFFFIFFSFSGKAQTCTPYTIYKDDFGGKASDPEQGPPLASGVTSYSYTKNIPVKDGFYGIRKKVKGHTGTWHSMTDHTGGGYMMLVNASIDPGLFYQKKITDLCQGTSFDFSVYVANLMKKGAGGPKDPSLRFVIKNPNTNAIIADTTTGYLPRYANPTWEKYGIHFDLPQGLSAVILQIYNNGEGGDGNDLVLDDITFSICGPPLVYTVTGMYKNGDNVCEGKKVNLKATLPNGGIQQPEFQWQFSEDKSNWTSLPNQDQKELHFNNIKPKDSGWYRFLVAEKGNISKEKCRVPSASIPIKVWEPPDKKIVADDPVCEGSPFHMKIKDAGSLSMHWEGPNHFISDKKEVNFSPIQLQQAGEYTIQIKNLAGCEITRKKNITVLKNPLVAPLSTQDSQLCEGEQQDLYAKNPGASYLWSTGATDSSIQVNTAGWYSVKISKGLCSLTDSIHLYNVKAPTVHLTPDTTLCPGETYPINVGNPYVDHYLWNDGSRDSIKNITQAGYYQVTLKNTCGVAKASTYVTMEPYCVNSLLFPTGFTPNGDGENDVFKPKVYFSITHYHLVVFDRWGNRVFQSNDPEKGWDGTRSGKPYPMAAYVWKATYERVRDGKKFHQKGSITLIR